MEKLGCPVIRCTPEANTMLYANRDWKTSLKREKCFKNFKETQGSERGELKACAFR